MARGGVSALVLAFGLLPLHSANTPPHFADFPLAAIYRNPVKPPTFGSTEKFEGTEIRCFAVEAGEFAKERVNFAGHFIIGTCPCGSGCHSLFMWDAITGKFYQRLPPGVIDVGPYDTAGPDPVEYKGEQYRVDSSLLIVDGCIEGSCDCATRYYRWDGSRFRKISSVVSRVPAKCRK